MPVLTPDLAGRQEPHIITQTIVQGSATYTTLITLGTTMPTKEPEADKSPGGSGISSLELGGILGAVVGVVVIFLIFCFCCGGRTKQVQSYTRSQSRPAADAASRIQRPPAVVERVPGGPKFPTYRAIPIPNPRNPQVYHYR